MAEKEKKYKSYSLETKLEVAKKYLEGFSSDDLQEQYGIVSKTQIKVWTRKYKNGGLSALASDHRGRPKKSPEQNEIEQLRMENEILKKIQDLLEQEKP